MRGGEGRGEQKGDNSTVGTRRPVPGRYFGNRRPIINRKSRKPLTSETVRRLYAGYVAANHTLCRDRGRAPTNRASCLTKKIMRCVNFACHPPRRSSSTLILPTYKFFVWEIIVLAKNMEQCLIPNKQNPLAILSTNFYQLNYRLSILRKIYMMSYIYVKFQQII